MRHIKLYEYYQPSPTQRELDDFKKKFDRIMKGDKREIADKLNALVDQMSEEEYPLFYELVSIIQDVSDGGAERVLEDVVELATKIVRGIEERSR